MTVLVIVTRLALSSSLRDPLVPTMAILVAPLGVAGVAWFSLVGCHSSPIAAMFAGLGDMFVLVQLALHPEYGRLKISLGFWSFTFPATAVVCDAMLWLRFTAPSGWQVVTVVLATAPSVLVLVTPIRSVREVVFHTDVKPALRAANHARKAVSSWLQECASALPEGDTEANPLARLRIWGRNSRKLQASAARIVGGPVVVATYCIYLRRASHCQTGRNALDARKDVVSSIALGNRAAARCPSSARFRSTVVSGGRGAFVMTSQLSTPTIPTASGTATPFSPKPFAQKTPSNVAPQRMRRTSASRPQASLRFPRTIGSPRIRVLLPLLRLDAGRQHAGAAL